ncbi:MULTISPECIES: GNAT family N-acetyltransferase [Henriciella]|jgi:RimJ/RimL family protein N-acetyltransferase|uniref:GCN5 family N-acetyltransferase n=1 Tax=Henriciella pelagia TaxID=1977912 RepID=A0ABQ1JKZ1_9PROT|nr:GNAT family protein [Henriciella pelagia]GGB68917.1 GCN5 family N-acetyltransferase [Henriciella pelagia]
MELNAPGLETSLIRIEPMAESHREAIVSSRAVDDMWEFMPVIPDGQTLNAYFDHTLRMSDIGTGQGLVVFQKKTGRLVGLAAFILPNRLHRRVRVGYTWLEESQRGTGIATHVQYLMIKRAMEWRARRVEWMMSTRSERAFSQLTRLGAVHEGTLRRYTRMADGGWADVFVFSLIDEEIEAALGTIGEMIGEVTPASGA